MNERTNKRTKAVTCQLKFNTRYPVILHRANAAATLSMESVLDAPSVTPERSRLWSSGGRRRRCWTTSSSRDAVRFVKTDALLERSEARSESRRVRRCAVRARAFVHANTSSRQMRTAMPPITPSTMMTVRHAIDGCTYGSAWGLYIGSR